MSNIWYDNPVGPLCNAVSYTWHMEAVPMTRAGYRAHYENHQRFPALNELFESTICKVWPAYATHLRDLFLWILIWWLNTPEWPSCLWKYSSNKWFNSHWIYEYLCLKKWKQQSQLFHKMDNSSPHVSCFKTRYSMHDFHVVFIEAIEVYPIKYAYDPMQYYALFVVIISSLLVGILV